MRTKIPLDTRIREFAEKLAASTDAARTSDELLAYLQFAASFHHYSLHNTLLIFMQKPDATRVAGFHAWKSLGRYVRKGEKGIAIMAPIRVKANDNGQEDDAEAEGGVIGFRTVYVFDVEQTEGEPLPPDLCVSRASCSEELTEALVSFARAQEINVEFTAVDGGAYGRSKGGLVEVDDGLESADRFAVLLHELAHEFLNHRHRRSELDRKTREIEAETVAHIVCHHFGVATAAPNYLALNGADGKEVIERLEHIVGTIHSLIHGITSHQEIPAQSA
ncbi:MAG: ArdC-like ssDNA-binding domain-containing protein [Deltaproteobacteria bacterium]|nr:ArdC-like ssDNA-binding domain-containing protein [Deltaproteobacteria bacterium]